MPKKGEKKEKTVDPGSPPSPEPEPWGSAPKPSDDTQPGGKLDKSA